jgi:hypothetical protein
MRTGATEAQDQPGLHSETLPQTGQQKISVVHSILKFKYLFSGGCILVCFVSRLISLKAASTALIIMNLFL